jgi:ABC-type phosphate/phosphonate transport system substrate-binding protein
MEVNKQIALGMYSLNSEIEGAWQRLFNQTADFFPEIEFPKRIVNTIEESVVLAKNTCLSHICGYPLLNRYAEHLLPLSAPQFEIQGVTGAQYYSYFVVQKNSKIASILSAKGESIAVNSLCSNSGLNVFRQELKLASDSNLEEFFGRVMISGSHLESIKSILKGESTLAAIDAATFCYLCTINPFYRDELKIIGQSSKSAAPPIVTHKDNPFCESGELTEALNRALFCLDEATRDTLKIKRFCAVTMNDYTPMLAS